MLLYPTSKPWAERSLNPIAESAGAYFSIITLPVTGVKNFLIKNLEIYSEKLLRKVYVIVNMLLTEAVIALTF